MGYLLLLQAPMFGTYALCPINATSLGGLKLKFYVKTARNGRSSCAPDGRGMYNGPDLS